MSAAPRPAAAPTGATCNLPESDAEALVILNQFYPNRYYWDHTDLTIAIQAAPNVDQAYIDAARPRSRPGTACCGSASTG